MARDAALLRTLVTRVRVIVTVLETAARMTATEAAREIWCVGPTTARSSDITTMRRMTAVRGQGMEDHQEDHGLEDQDLEDHGLVGPNGAASARAAPGAASGPRRGLGCAQAQSAGQHSTLRRHRSGPVWASSAEEGEEDGPSSIIILENKVLFLSSLLSSRLLL